MGFFEKHFEHALLQTEEACIKNNQTKKLIKHSNGYILYINYVSTKNFGEVDINNAKIDQTILKNYRYISGCEENQTEKLLFLTNLQHDLFSLFYSYKDVFFLNRNFENSDEIKEMYIVHALNHSLSLRKSIIKNNKQLDKKETGDVRDKGFTKPRILILVPFKNSAFKIVNFMILLLSNTLTKKNMVSNKIRFFQEYGPTQDDTHVKFPTNARKELFEGNVEDCFKIGISLSKKSLKLYTEFYKSDIIIASPLGLKTLGLKTKTVVSAEHMEDVNRGYLEEDENDEKETLNENFDFLSSIDILIIDQADVFLMQNWSHLISIMNEINKRPLKSHDTDFSRIREYFLNDQSKFYRQTLIFSSIRSPQLNNLYRTYCQNYEGRVMMDIPYIKGTLCEILSVMKHEFLVIHPTTSSPSDMANNRFLFFTEYILPKIVQPNRSCLRRTLISIPSYFDYVRLRNYLTDKDISFLAVNEYDDEKHIRKVRRAIQYFEETLLDDGSETESNNNTVTQDMGDAKSFNLKTDKSLLVLNTERSYFFRKPRLQNIYECIFYELPTYPNYYVEIHNDYSIPTKHQNKLLQKMTCIIDHKYDGIKLENVLGTVESQKFLQEYEQKSKEMLNLNTNKIIHNTNHKRKKINEFKPSLVMDQEKSKYEPIFTKHYLTEYHN